MKPFFPSLLGTAAAILFMSTGCTRYERPIARYAEVNGHSYIHLAPENDGRTGNYIHNPDCRCLKSVSKVANEEIAPVIFKSNTK